MKTIRFNTGRGYTLDGQRITATLHEDWVVTFYDHDRMIDGEFKPCGNKFDQSIVMHAYDHNIAKSTSRSWADAMCEDGCNARWEIV